jgi:RNA polymerase-binding transcription factor DksA
LWFRLEVTRKQLIDELEQLEAGSRLVIKRQGNSTWAKEDELADRISELERRSTLVKLLREQLEEIENALRKKDQGTYGLCDNRGQPIDFGRLEALPQANLCLNCKADQNKSIKGGLSPGRRIR